MEENTRNNIAETVRDIMADRATPELIDVTSEFDATSPSFVAVPDGSKLQEVTAEVRRASEFFQPMRRRGTATMQDMQSLILWANRFKGENSAIYAKESKTEPAIRVIADYHQEGPAAVGQSDSTARPMAHQAVYKFPISEEWRLWNNVSGKWLGKDEMGEFIEARALDVMDPTPGLLPGGAPVEEWEKKLARIAQAVEGRFGQYSAFLQMSKRFQVYETSNLQVKTNRDTGEQSIEFLNEHMDAEGKPISLPNLVIIAIPVVVNGPKYRMAVRFRYKKQGSGVGFQFTLYEPDRVLKDVFDEAKEKIEQETTLPVFLGEPEAS